MDNVIVRDDARCDGCGACVRNCPQLVYEQAKPKTTPAIEESHVAGLTRAGVGVKRAS